MKQDPITRPNWPTKIRWSLKRRGVVGTLRLALLKPLRKLGDWLWDRIHRVETTAIVEIDDADIASDNVQHGIRYQATPARVFRRIIRSLEIPYEEFTFIDFGSGKGRTLLLASQFPFKSIIGIEFAPELHSTAESNIRSFRGRQRCHQVQSICMDAAQYRLSPEKAVLYFNFPFHEPVMRAVLDRIDGILQNSSADVILVNYEPHPPIARLLGNDPALGIVAQHREYAIYRSRIRAEG